MWPDTGHDRFDLIVVPEHDRKGSGSNIMSVLLSPTDLCKRGTSQVEPGSCLALIGGPRRGAKPDLRSFIDAVSKKALNRQVWFVTSPRTPASWTKGIDVEPNEAYPDLLKRADWIAVTGESISMMADAAAFGRPILLDQSNLPSGSKLEYTHQALIKAKMAIPLGSDQPLDSYKPYRSSIEIARAIQQRGLITSS